MFTRITPQTAAALARLAKHAPKLVRWCESGLPIRGGDNVQVRSNASGTTISTATQRTPAVALQQGGGGTNVRIVRITTALGTTAYGKYNARTITPTTITGSNWTATTGAPTVSGMFGSGSEATEDDAIFLNLEELGNDGTTYVLTQDNPDATNIYAIGLVVGTHDGKLLVSGVSLKSRVCEE